MWGRKTMCKMNKWQYLRLPQLTSVLVDKRFLDNFAFGRLRWRLRKTSDFFGNVRKRSCHLQKSQHSQDKNLTPISQKKLAGIQITCCISSINCEKVFTMNMCMSQESQLSLWQPCLFVRVINIRKTHAVLYCQFYETLNDTLFSNNLGNRGKLQVSSCRGLLHQNDPQDKYFGDIFYWTAPILQWHALDQTPSVIVCESSNLTHWLLELFAKSAFFGHFGDF